MRSDLHDGIHGHRNRHVSVFCRMTSLSDLLTMETSFPCFSTRLMFQYCFDNPYRDYLFTIKSSLHPSSSSFFLLGSFTLTAPPLHPLRDSSVSHYNTQFDTLIAPPLHSLRDLSVAHYNTQFDTLTNKQREYSQRIERNDSIEKAHLEVAEGKMDQLNTSRYISENEASCY